MALWKDSVKLGTKPKDGSAYQGSGGIQWGGTRMANEIPAHANEFHATKAGGYEVKKVLEVNPVEYSGEKYAFFHGKAYRIYRTHPKSDRVTELYLTDNGV